MIYKLIAIIWTIAIVIASGLSKGTVQRLNLSALFGFDKLLHAGVYMIYVILWYLALSKSDSERMWKWSFVSSIILGLVMEILQYAIFTGRSFDYLDIIANISGSVIGLIMIFKFLKK